MLLYILVLIPIITAQDPITNQTLANSIRNQSETNHQSGSSTRFPPHRYTSSNNITILHEVHDVESQQTEANVNRTAPDESTAPISESNEDISSQKNAKKKKPYTILDKVLPILDKPKPLKEYEMHPVVFDFNLGDLEDLEHESVKKDEVSTEEQMLLHNIEDLQDEDKIAIHYDNDDLINPMVDVLEDTVVAEDLDKEHYDDNMKITIVMPNASLPTNATTSSTTPSVKHVILPTAATIGPHIFKISKNKSSKKERELMKKEEFQKTFGANFNSISRYFGGNDPLSITSTNDTAADKLIHSANIFQIVTNLYDHFYWQSSVIQSKVTTGCGLEMQAYLTGLHGNYEWAQKGNIS